MFRQLRRREDGVTIVEFAFVAPVLILFVTGLLEIGYILFARSTLESAVLAASREARVSPCPNDVASAVETRLQDRMSVIMSVDDEPAALTVESYSSNFGDVGNPEPFDDVNDNGTRDPGESYTDTNGNGEWDEDMGLSGDFGGFGDVVRFTASQDVPSLFPFFANTVTDGQPHYTLTAVTVVRNEPFTDETC
ncbi:TadE/TadG family type IV pilus assembly protein [Erythrobacter sp.]|uniref:TadE/TadG family type IV pilus assembly protein n=1 Tax=Erythrobacter sp. TaxID=1042 RepID=UPI002EA781EE|nr:TadE family protein [Erythrobacter sp.]